MKITGSVFVVAVIVVIVFSGEKKIHSFKIVKINYVEPCRHEIKNWMLKNKLTLNEQKTEKRKESVPVDRLSVGQVSILFSSAVKTL